MSASVTKPEPGCRAAHWRSVHLAGDRGAIMRPTPIFFPFWKSEHELRAIKEKRRG